MSCLCVLFVSFVCAQRADHLSAATLKRKIAVSAPDSTRTALLLLLAHEYVIKPGAGKGNLDTAQFLLQQAWKLNGSLHNKVLTTKTCLDIAQLFRKKGDPGSGYYAALRAYKASQEIKGYPEERGEIYTELASYTSLNSKKDFEQRINYYRLAAEQFAQAGDKLKQADALKNEADYNQIISNYGEALINLNQALPLYVAARHKELQGVYDLLGTVSAALGDYPGAVKYGLLAVKTAEEVHDTSMQLCTIYNRLSAAYGNWNKYTEGLMYAKKSLAIARKYNDRNAILILLNSVCNYMADSSWKEDMALIKDIDRSLGPKTMTEKVRMYICYDMVNLTNRNFRTADLYADSIIAATDTLPDDSHLKMLVTPCLTEHFLVAHEYRKAAAYADFYLKQAQQNGEIGTQEIAHHKLSEAYAGMGNYRIALDHFSKHNNMRDSALSKTKSMQFAQMQVQYETDKKDHELLLRKKNIELLKNKAQLQDIKIKKATQGRTIIIAASLFLLGIMYTGYEIKKRHNARLLLQQQAIKEQNQQLNELLEAQQKLVTEKEWLMKEVHHRVKNNLQIVISLLNAQSEFLDSPSALDAIRESRERMQTIALIHQKLYQTEDTTVINMSSYIRELVAFLSSSFADSWKIRFDFDVEDISLDVSQAVPVGLILNETITNAIKYAFPGDCTGIVHVGLKPLDDRKLQLTVKDNGRGFGNDVDTCKPESLGIQLVRLFSDQLEGDLTISGTDGVEIKLEFKEYEAEKPKDDITMAA
ncbi:histidine kinase dimerization/phosphoacceptor domain -containing protein [Chitinophagaceae bacterium MMS25-I14]